MRIFQKYKNKIIRLSFAFHKNNYFFVKLNKKFKHLTVNHSINFKNPENGVHINGIESLWRKAKSKIKKMNGIKRGYILPYLNEFMWRHNFRNEDLFYFLIRTIKKIFPLNSSMPQ